MGYRILYAWCTFEGPTNEALGITLSLVLGITLSLVLGITLSLVLHIIIIISFYSYTVHLHKNKYTGIVFWSIFTVYLRNLHIHIQHLPDLKE